MFTTAVFHLRAASRRLPDDQVQLWTGCALVVFSIWGCLLYVLVDVSRDAREQRRAAAFATATGFAEYARMHLLQVDRMLLSLRDAYRDTGTVPEQHLLSARLMAAILIQVSIAHPDGTIAASSLPFAPGVSIADREHFLQFVRDPSDRLYVSSPVIGRVSQRKSIQLARPLRADGRFGGVIVASVDAVALQRYFEAVNAFAHEGTVSMLHATEGRVLAHFTARGITGGQSFADAHEWKQLRSAGEGTFTARSSVDGSRRMFGFRRTEGFPVMALASTELGPLPGLADGRSVVAILVALVCTASLVFLTRVLARRSVEQQRVIAKLRQSQAREAQANRLKSGFLATMSHELRTPLHSILGFSELIRDAGTDPKASQYARLIHGSGEHLLSLLNTLLDLAKIEAGRMEVHRERVDLTRLITTLAETHRVNAERKGVDLTVTFADGAGTRLHAHTDATKFTQIVNNVLHNAVKFCSQGAIRVGVERDDGDLILRVADSGCGIPPHMVTQVFERFRRSDDEFREQEGTGLGLPLSRELATLLGGTIEIQSWPGKGTTVEVRLPHVEVAEASA